MFHSRQTSAGNGQWQPWQQLDLDTTWAAFDVRHVAAVNSLGLVEVIGVDADGQLLTRSQSLLDPSSYGSWDYLSPGRLRGSRLPNSAPQAGWPGDQASTVGASVAIDLTVSGGTGPFVWSFAGLPAGITGDAAGRLRGVATVPGPGSTVVIATVTDTLHLSSTTTFTWRILTTVPDLLGLKQALAIAELQTAGLTGQITLDYSCLGPTGFVVTQIPTAGSHAALGATVNVHVSTGHNTHGQPCHIQ